jgi:hypothetical protein
MFRLSKEEIQSFKQAFGTTVDILGAAYDIKGALLHLRQNQNNQYRIIRDVTNQEPFVSQYRGNELFDWVFEDLESGSFSEEYIVAKEDPGNAYFLEEV